MGQEPKETWAVSYTHLDVYKRQGQGLYDWSQKDADDFRRRKQSPYFAGVKEWAMPDVK